jgi:hypothetical protein
MIRRILLDRRRRKGRLDRICMRDFLAGIEVINRNKLKINKMKTHSQLMISISKIIVHMLNRKEELISI